MYVIRYRDNLIPNDYGTDRLIINIKDRLLS